MTSRLGTATTALRDALERLRPTARKKPDATPTVDADNRVLSERVMATLGLQHQPFRDHVPPHELFSDHAIEMQLNMLGEHLRTGDVLPVLRGEPGAGKTAIVILLLQRLSREQHVFIARGDPDIRATRVVMDMLRILIRPIPATAGECYRELCRILGELTCNDGQPAMLVVDDAHRLPETELQNLLTMHDHLQKSLEGHFRLLLSADSSIEHSLSNLESRQITSGAITTSAIRPFNRARIPAYIGHRLKTAGASGADLLNDEALDRIARDSAGLPRAVESAAARELEYTFGK